MVSSFKMLNEAIPWLKHFQKIVLALYFLVWDCFGEQLFRFQKVILAALRAMTDTEWEGAVMLFLVFIQLLKFCGPIRNFEHSGLHSPFLGYQINYYSISQLI